MASFAQFGNDLYTGKRSYDFVGKRRIWYTIAIAMMIVSIAIPLIKGGFNFGIEFRGGSQFVVSGVTEVQQPAAEEAVGTVDSGTVVHVSKLGTDAVRIQTDQLTDDESLQVKSALAEAYGVDESEITSSFIGASWGADVTGQALRGLVVFLVLAAVVMALYFRTWKMSAAAMLALLHDLVITAGVYAATGFEITPAAVIGFLTILGYSLYDTVVVFDKVRENTAQLGDDSRYTFGEAVNLAVNQTLVRSINTGVVAALPVAAILFIGAFILGADTLRDISLALLVGILIGTYSTIFIAAPLYAQFREKEPTISKRDKRVLTSRERAKTPESDEAAIAG
ncbi:protein translocase subunit SecF [Compostimonas suwonensis]|uniref:Protein-export membrane protein SecF n=1 Tax=Compostimonas suwonensis TaxID=1048394 RepID=A0A2M9BBS6_9MICO|nr:protein translocase subunit SecF [Compostimonas suwonensis]PJJ55401.1 preprotein translocase subunit SecF [Compostimonas suwonensis]